MRGWWCLRTPTSGIYLLGPMQGRRQCSSPAATSRRLITRGVDGVGTEKEQGASGKEVVCRKCPHGACGQDPLCGGMFPPPTQLCPTTCLDPSTFRQRFRQRRSGITRYFAVSRRPWTTTPQTAERPAIAAVQLQSRAWLPGTPNGIRTRAATLRGWCPRPLDDGGLVVPLRRSQGHNDPGLFGGEDSNPQ